MKDIRIDTQPYSLPRGRVAGRGGRGGRGGQNARSTSQTRKDSVNGRGGRGARNPSPQQTISYRRENPDYRIAAWHDRKASWAGSGGQIPRELLSKAPKLEFNWRVSICESE